MADNYLSLTNKLRRRFNEVDLTSGTTWGTAVGFDQFTKDAINYAYHDILNAEMEWPFLHLSSAFLTTPGIALYTPSLASDFLTIDGEVITINGERVTSPISASFTSPVELKEFDWDGFFVDHNFTVVTVNNELRTVPTSSPYSIALNSSLFIKDLGVTYNSGGASLFLTNTDPGAFQYTIINGIYYFNAADAGKAVNINYKYINKNPIAVYPNAGQLLRYIDYDGWRQAYLSTDIPPTSQRMPVCIYRTNNHGELGLSPVPDKGYLIKFEYWVDALDLSSTTDTPLLPSHFWQVIIEGAVMYVHKFREDLQMATAAEKRFMQGISRMRTELINRESDMSTGFYWYPHGTSYTLNTK